MDPIKANNYRAAMIKMAELERVIEKDKAAIRKEMEEEKIAALEKERLQAEQEKNAALQKMEEEKTRTIKNLLSVKILTLDQIAQITNSPIEKIIALQEEME